MFDRLAYHYARGGFRAIFRALIRKMAHKLDSWLDTEPPPLEGYLNDLRFVLKHAETRALNPPSKSIDMRRMNLHWIIPDFRAGAGGHMTIFRTIHYLESFGHQNTLWIMESTRYGSGERARDAIRTDFIQIRGEVHTLADRYERVEGDAVIATDRWTAYSARSVTHVRHRFYFVQDFEPMFFPMGSEYLLAEQTYRFGYTCITAGKWLERLMAETYRARVYRFDQACDHSTYRNLERVSREERRIAFYARPATPRRALELGLLALEILGGKVPGLVVDFFGGSVAGLSPMYRFHDFGVVSHHILAEIYNRATVGVVFSTTNYSLIPHEMMACGLPVVDILGENTTAVFPEDVITLSDSSPWAIAASIERLLLNPTLREAKAVAAKRYVENMNWEASVRQIEFALKDVLEKTVKSTCSPKTPPQD